MLGIELVLHGSHQPKRWHGPPQIDRVAHPRRRPHNDRARHAGHHAARRQSTEPSPKLVDKPGDCFRLNIPIGNNVEYAGPSGPRDRRIHPVLSARFPDEPEHVGELTDPECDLDRRPVGAPLVIDRYPAHTKRADRRLDAHVRCVGGLIRRSLIRSRLITAISSERGMGGAAFGPFRVGRRQSGRPAREERHHPIGSTVDTRFIAFEQDRDRD